jgi:secreted trypsin-like serine protease
MNSVRRALAIVAAALAVVFTTVPASADTDHSLDHEVVPYIIGGVLSVPGTWPGMVALVHETPTGLAQFCGGTLIRSDLVLTAAHCTESFVNSPSQLLVLLGRTDLSTTGGELVPASAIIEHPNWDETTYSGDISIVRLSQRSTRATVPFLNAASEPNWATFPQATLVGWGATDPDPALSSLDGQLREVDVNVLADQECVDFFNNRSTVFRVGVDLCAGGVSSGPCFGDSGGPLMTRNAGPVAAIGGVISRGTNPCGTGPGIVTRVSAYADWIYASTQSANTTRTSGADRYATAATLSARFAPGAPVAYLVTGEQFPDAVTAAAIAGANGGPVLLTRRGDLPEVTRNELARLRPLRLIVVGGSNAVSDEVAAAAGAAAGVGTTRIAGSNRYATAAALSADAYAGGAHTVFVTVGTAFPDAVASGPVAGGPNGGPVLLTESGALPPATADELVRAAPARVVILGGGSAVSQAVQDQIAALLQGVLLERISGPDRYATSAALSSSTFAPGVPVVYLATGRAFPDALASGPVAVTNGAPVLLIDGNQISPSVANEIHRLSPGTLVILGGNAAISAETAWFLDGLLAN